MDNLTFMAKVASGDRSVQVLRNILQMQKRAYDSAADAVAGGDDGISEVARYLASLSSADQGQTAAPAPAAPSAPAGSGSNAVNDTVVAGARLLGGYGGWKGGARLGTSLGNRLGTHIGRGVGHVKATLGNFDLLHPGAAAKLAPNMNFHDLAGNPISNASVRTDPAVRQLLTQQGKLNRTLAKGALGRRGAAIGAKITRPIVGGVGAIGGALGAGYLADKTMNLINPYKGEGSAM